MNTYGYVGGNPVINTDPEGLAYSPYGEHGILPDGSRDPNRAAQDECIHKCMQDQWGVGNTLSGLGAAPIPKPLLGMPVVGNASPVTNAVSAIGHYATRNLPGRGKIGRQILGTNRWAGLAGRANILAFTGMLAYDAGKCQLKCAKEGKECK